MTGEFASDMSDAAGTMWLDVAKRDWSDLMLQACHFTAPKLLWVQRHEPEIFRQIDKVLLPKDYLRLRMTGEFASDMSDAAGTMWLDVAKRDWSDLMLQACHLSRDQMPALYEGSEITGALLPEVAKAWGMAAVPVIAGGGDNAAGAVGVGMVDANQAMLSLGTSGVYFAVSEGFLSKPESAVHSFCHALPQRWHLMSVMLSAASCLDWAAKLTGLSNVPALITAARQADESAEPLWFLPYLSGERTPHNNPQAKGVFFGLTHQHGPNELARAVLEGVGYALADGMDVVHGVWPRCLISQAVPTMQLVLLVWDWLILNRQCYRRGRRGSILLSAKGSLASEKAPYIAFAMRYRIVGI